MILTSCYASRNRTVWFKEYILSLFVLLGAGEMVEWAKHVLTGMET